MRAAVLVPPDPALVWRACVHRFDVEHTLRFCKERLGWDRARVRTPEHMDRWTWVILTAYTQLRLARRLTACPGFKDELRADTSVSQALT